MDCAERRAERTGPAIAESTKASSLGVFSGNVFGVFGAEDWLVPMRTFSRQASMIAVATTVFLKGERAG